MPFVFEKTLAGYVMSDKFIIVNHNIKLQDATEIMLKNHLQEIFLENEYGEIVGVRSLTDISNIIKNGPKNQALVSDTTSKKLIVARINDTLADCRDIMIKEKIGRLPIMEEGRLVGVIRQEQIRDYYYSNMEKVWVDLNQIIDNIHEAVSVIDKDGKVILWNRSAERLYNLSFEKIAGEDIRKFFPNAAMLKVLNTKKSVSNIYHSPREGAHVAISALPIFDGGEFKGVVASERDLTEVKELSEKLQYANGMLDFLKNEIKKFSVSGFENIIGESQSILEKINIAKQVSKSNSSILITGESGTGKEVFARAIHENSGRTGLFIPVNCSAIPTELFESEFFGYEEGAFTGAKKKGKLGIIELANKGTLFLDELGDMPVFMQSKLLRVLQEKQFRRVGGEKSIGVDIRVISATNKNLKEMIGDGSFREDLYYRLNVVEIKLPSLRERKSDIRLLINYFVKEISEKTNKKIIRIEKEFYRILEDYQCHGNIRELKNIIEYSIVLCNNGIIDKSLIPDHVLQKNGKDKTHIEEYALDLNEAIIRTEINTIQKALKLSRGRKTKAAKLLNIPRSTLYYKLQNYNITWDD